MLHNGLQLQDLAIFTTNVDAKNKTLIYHKCVCGALKRHFCQTRVMRSIILFHHLLRHCLLIDLQLLSLELLAQ